MRRLSFPRPAILPGWGFGVYLILVAVAILYTQLLRSPASSLFFWFLMMLPPVSVVYLLIARLTIKIYVETGTAVAEKLAPVSYEVKLVNEFLFPYSRVDALLTLPTEDGIRAKEYRMSLSLLPFAGQSVKDTVRFPYRGRYDIGVRALEVWDFLHMFHLYIDVDTVHTVSVLPRRLRAVHESVTAATDVPTDSSRVVHGFERTEMGDIRSYQPGDPLKSIHWKLSARLEEMQVKEYNANTARSVYILCDLSRAGVPEEARVATRTARTPRNRIPIRLKGQEPHSFRERLDAWRAAQAESRYRKLRERGKTTSQAADIEGLDDLIRNTSREGVRPNPSPEETSAPRTPVRDGGVKPEYRHDMDEYCADGTSEMAIAALLHELRLGNSCTLLWYDAREESGVGSAVLHSPEEFDAVYPRFGTAPVGWEEDRVAKLTLLVEESMNVTLRVVTAHLDALSLSEYAAVPAMFGGAGTGCITEILLFDPEYRYADVAARREYVAMCQEQLAQDGVILTPLSPVPADMGKEAGV